MKPNVLLLQTGPLKQYLNLLDIMHVALAGQDATISMSPGEVFVQGGAGKARQALAEKYARISLGSAGVAGPNSTGRKAKMPVLFINPSSYSEFAVFQRGLRALNIYPDRVELELVKPFVTADGTRTPMLVVALTRPLSTSDRQALQSLALA